MTHTYHCLDLSDVLNHKACSFKGSEEIGYLTILGSSIPEELMPLKQVFEYESIPFFMAKQNIWDNVELAGQRIFLPEINASAIHIIGTSDNTDMEEDVEIYYKKSLIHSIPLKLNYFGNNPSNSDNECFIQLPFLYSKSIVNTKVQPCIWYTRLILPEPSLIDSILLGENPCMHIFSITVEKATGKDYSDG
ncbi:hypothetical protein KFZ56_05110 [Virgibacillus sp. NKC19-3]|uniref:hypothetical protein n=1 Tax=Virgibacillus saliphilus TaxID=2831674 RepID=UPI001C9B06BA|nr:hypothetical protein [Virgibacillus sp. NKC19-3]MBY7142467.1 hypothetical protein [Virgibacillus sp. NKC19-3]